MNERTHKRRWILSGMILLLVILGVVAGASWMAYNAGRVSGAQEAVAVMQSQEGAKGSEMPGAGYVPFGPWRFRHGPAHFGWFGGPPAFFPFIIGGILFKLLFWGLIILLLIALLRRLFRHHGFGWHGPWGPPPPGWEPPPGWKEHWGKHYPWSGEEPKSDAEKQE
jgi:hypothetical protein